jgi:DNA-binding protein HU-beta
MNKNDLVLIISEKTGIDKDTVLTVLDETHESIVRSLKKGDSVKISGFGTFYPSKRESRRGRNPKTGHSIIIPEKTVTKFRPGKTTKDL